MADADKDLVKALDEHLKRLYEQYKSNSKVFNATHIGHLTLSIVFVLSILLPFLYLQIDARDTNAEVRRLSQSIARQEQHVAVYRQAIAGLKKVFEAVENTPKPLQGFIRALEKEADGGPVAALPDGLQPPPEPCGSPSDEDRWMACRTRQYLAASAAKWQAILANEIAAPLETLHIKEFDQWKADLQAGMRRHAERAKAEMAANPGFWRGFSPDSPVYRDMVEGVHRFWAEHQFEEIERRMETAATAWRADIETLNKKKDAIQKSKEGLNNALKNIKTRFGKLGLELEDAILLAPVAFSAIFLVAALNLSKNIQLRKSFHRLFQAKDPQRIALTDSEIALAMPLWLDPLAPPMQRRIKFAVLLIPAFASALTLLVVFYCWTIPDAFPGLTGLDYVKYMIYYLIGVGLFILAFQRIRGAIRNYGEPPTGTQA